MNTKIKICRVRDIPTAIELENLGVEFIGFHIIWNLNQEKETLYKNIIKVLEKTKIVVVTRTKDLKVLDLIVGSLRPEFIQLHSCWSKEELKQLRSFIGSNYHYIPKIIGVVALENVTSINLIDEIHDSVDYILFDSSFRGGTGILTEENLLRDAIQRAKSYDIQFFIAGGLTPDNVGYYVKTYRPYGVDVQTGVEILGVPGCKDYIKVRKFIEEVRKEKQ
jgi:phosphoribosylanthranilate isomerase